MASYFDISADKNLLPLGIRSAAELANVAAMAEAAVIGAFTMSPSYYLYTAYDSFVRTQTNATWLLGYSERGAGEDISATTPGAAQIRVFLTGYKVDAAHADVDPNLKTAMKRTIAMVIRWWMVGWNRGQGLASSSDLQSKTRSYRDNADHAFPPDWDMFLRPFDCRPLAWGL